MGPFGSVEPIHVESGDTVTVDVNFYDVDLSNIEYNVNVPLDTSLLPWWSTVYDYTVPGGTYIGGTLEVIPKINGVEVDRKSGTMQVSLPGMLSIRASPRSGPRVVTPGFRPSAGMPVKATTGCREW